MKNKKPTERFLVQLHPSKLVNTIFCLVSSLCRPYIIQYKFSNEIVCRQIPIQTQSIWGPTCRSTQNTTRGAIFLRIRGLASGPKIPFWNKNVACTPSISDRTRLCRLTLVGSSICIPFVDFAWVFPYFTISSFPFKKHIKSQLKKYDCSIFMIYSVYEQIDLTVAFSNWFQFHD